jgi:hypothetical protein
MLPSALKAFELVDASKYVEIVATMYEQKLTR